MPTRVQRRSGDYPVRVSLNVTVETSEVVDYLEQTTGEYRGVIVRESLNIGLALYQRILRRRRRREGKAERTESAVSATKPADRQSSRSQGVPSSSDDDLPGFPFMT